MTKIALTKIMPFPLRLQEDLRDALKAEAERRDVSLNALITTALEDWLSDMAIRRKERG